MMPRGRRPQVLLAGGGALALVAALVDAACGALPPSLVTAAAGSLHAGWAAAGDEHMRAWLAQALARPGCPRPGTTEAAKRTFVTQLLAEANRRDVRRFKRTLKAFCGGKKHAPSNPALGMDR